MMTDEKKTIFKTNGDFAIVAVACLFAGIILLSSCTNNSASKKDVFIGQNKPEDHQEFRWNNGKLPKSLDPARASAPPETDIVRAIYDGLTDVDPKTSQPVPSIAQKWSSSRDLKTWIFQLRQDVKWTNGESVTANDFVRSWKRLVEMGEKVKQRNLLKNIVGMDSEDVLPVFASEPEISDSIKPASLNTEVDHNSNIDAFSKPQNEVNHAAKSPVLKKIKLHFGAEAVGKYTLRITLIKPDQELPLLLAHPIFHPIFGDDEENFADENLDADLVTNGAFRISEITGNSISLNKNQSYWNRDAVKLDKVKFVATENAEQSLAIYRNGEVDAVSNVSFQPLAIKLLKPYDEFHQITNGALNYYEFNEKLKPFDDLRVREALAIAIERERLTDDEMDGATQPAFTFLPFEENVGKIVQDPDKAKELLKQAGFENGENFPVVKLLINRNNVQQIIARSVAKMWLKNLNIKTEIIVKDSSDFDNSYQLGEFSLARRGLVLPTHNEKANMLMMFGGHTIPNTGEKHENRIENTVIGDANGNSNSAANDDIVLQNSDNQPLEKFSGEKISEQKPILTEGDALEKLPAIPLYFPTSYSLVKPYVKGFELDAFDSPLLKNVAIDSEWHPIPTKNNAASLLN